VDLPRAAAFAARFAAGFAAVLCFTGLFWRLSPDDLPSSASCLASGALAAGMFAFVRGGQAVQALALGAAAVSFQLAALWYQGPARALAAAAGNLVETGGIATSAVVFHLLAERGVRFGKFLLTGPMVAVAFAAAGPASLVGAPASDSPLRPLITGGLIGLIVGDAVGLGLEAGELGARLLQARGRSGGSLS
jgi:hypothetical protein